MLLLICLSVLLILLIIFVVLPLIFMSSVSLQQILIFTHWNLPHNKSYYENFRFSGLKNRYVTVKDTDNKTDITLGVWHMLPLKLTEEAINNPNFNYDEALRNSTYSVLLYFHGTGEDRGDSQLKYQMLRYFFHVIAFDYRNYGDSSRGQLFESSVVNDCVQLYNWLSSCTNAPIYFWGHSLGTALATATLSKLSVKNAVQGLMLEAAFTSLRDELYEHPYVKYLSWLPWFDFTIVRSLERNGFVFNTAKHILNADCPIMMFHAEDDEVVPCHMSRELYVKALSRQGGKFVDETVLHLFDASLEYEHIFMYRDPYMVFYIIDFLKMSRIDSKVDVFGSFQS